MTRRGALVAVLAAITVAVDLLAHAATHSHSWWHDTPGFDLAYGFLGCVAIVLLSKAAGKWWLQRPEQYWGDGGG